MSQKLISAIGVGFGVFYATGYGRVANNENQCNRYCRLLFEMKE